MAKTLAADLLAPYAEYLRPLADMPYSTVAKALIRAEAAHVAEVRNKQGEPFGGWKNQLPLEHSSPLGFFIQSCRTGDKSRIRSQRDSNPDRELRETYSTLCNAENVYVFEPAGMSTDQLIDYANTELYLYSE